eukprot:UC1_evm2s321
MSGNAGASATAAAAAAAVEPPPHDSRLGPLPGTVKNRELRKMLHKEQRRAKAKDKRERRAKRKREVEQLGDAAPKRVTRTIDNTRETDETMVDPEDAEVEADQASDEFSTYFEEGTVPKICVTTSSEASDRGVSCCPAYIQKAIAICCQL